MPAFERSLDFDRHRLSYRSSGEGPAIVALSQYWNRDTAARTRLLRQHHRVIEITPIGYGRSDRVPGHAGELIPAQVLAVADAEGLESFVLLGYSAGAAMAAGVACSTRRASALMAGTAAEELVLGQASTAGESDLEAATTLARHMAGRYGMSDEVGLVRLLAPESEVFLGRDYLSAQHVSPSTLAEVELAVRTLVEEARADARRVLIGSRASLEKVARKLAEAETLDQEELASLLAPPVRQRGQVTEPDKAVGAARSRTAASRRPAATNRRTVGSARP